MRKIKEGSAISELFNSVEFEFEDNRRVDPLTARDGIQARIEAKESMLQFRKEAEAKAEEERKQENKAEAEKTPGLVDDDKDDVEEA